MENSESIWIFVCVALFPIVAAYFVFFKRVTSILKERHSETYKELGEIGFIKNNTIVNSNKFITYLFLAKYRELNDGQLQKEASICRLLLIIGFMLFLVAFLLPVYIGMLT